MSDAPQLAFSNAPEYHQYQPQQSHHKQEAYAYTDDANHAPSRKSTILGLRRRNFWILIVIAFLVIAAAVGGGVGGALAVRNSGSKSEAAVPSQSTSPAPTLSSGGTSLASPSASGSAYRPLPAASVPEIDVSCPASLKAFSDSYNYQYDCSTDTSISGNDITGLYAYSLQQCVDACSTMNLVRGNITCKAITLDQDALLSYRARFGANCWLKSATEPRAANKRTTLATVKTSSG